MVNKCVEVGLILAEHTSPLRVSIPWGSLIAEALVYTAVKMSGLAQRPA